MDPTLNRAEPARPQQDSEEFQKEIIPAPMEHERLGAEYLAERGISPAQASAARIVAIAGNSTGAFKSRHSLVILYTDPYTGEQMTWGKMDEQRPVARIRLLGAEPRGFLPLPKKPNRYRQAPGSPVRAYFPWNAGIPWSSVLNDPSTPIIITEGEIKALAGCLHGWPTIGLGGIFNFRNDGVFLQELERIAWHGRRVYIVFDSDIPPSGDVDLAALRLAVELRRRGADVRRAKLPAADKKVGLDDFLAAGWDLQPILDAAEPVTPIVSREKPSETARLIEELVFQIDQNVTIAHWRDQFYIWSGTHYVPQSDTEIEAGIRAFLEMARTMKRQNEGKPIILPFNPKNSDIREVKDALRHHSLLPNHFEAPGFRCAAPNDPEPRDLVLVQNGQLHIPSSRLLNHTARLFNINVSSVDYDLTAPEPELWLKTLHEQFEDDEAQIATLQEWFGYCLSGDASQQKILVEIGPTRSGKSLHVHVLEQLLGIDSVASIALTGFGKSFGLWNLIGKRLAVVTDATESPHEMTDDAVSHLKGISGGDRQSIERKYLSNWNGKLDARIWLIANHPLKFHDKSGALAARFIVLQTRKSFFGNEDRELIAKLRPELAGILNWALQGLRRLRERGRFIQPDSSRPLLELMLEQMAPVRRFLEERCDLGPDYSVTQSALYQEWKLYCADTGYERYVGTQTTFVGSLVSAYVGITTARPHQPGKEGKALPRIFHGVRLKQDTSSAEQRARIASKLGGLS